MGGLPGRPMQYSTRSPDYGQPPTDDRPVLFEFLFFFGQELIPYRYSCYCSCFRWRDPLQKSLRLCRIKSDRSETWQDCSSSKYD